MKLEIKHLAPYLPYELKMIFEGKGGRIIILTGITNQGALGVTITNGHGGMWLNQSGFIPMMHPIEDFELFESITDEMSENEINALQRLLEFKVLPVGGYVHNVNGGAYLKMLENHIDVFDLIKNGLAVSVSRVVV